MVLVLRLKSDHKKFSDIGESLSRRDLMFSLVCIERIQLRGTQKESIEGLSMEIDLEICNRTIKCSSGESSLLIHRKESLYNFYFTKEQKQDKRGNFVFVTSVLFAVSWTGLDCCTSNLQRTGILPGNV